MLRLYESVIVIDPSLGDPEIDQVIEKLSQLVTDSEGEIKEVQRWGRRKIAYEIKGKREGYYTLLRFAGKPELIVALERACRLNDSILRHLFLKDKARKSPEPA